MNTENFLKDVEYNVKNTICIDFDGVIHDDYLGFHDGTLYGDPISGAIDAIKSLSTKYIVIIYTCKANPDRPLVDNKTGIDLIWDWLEKHKIKECVSDITFNKPAALAYIDDKAVRFENWDKTLVYFNKL